MFVATARLWERVLHGPVPLPRMCRFVLYRSFMS